MNKIKINRCPCGGEAFDVHISGLVCICCPECGLRTGWHEYIEDAIIVWDRASQNGKRGENNVNYETVG